MTTHPHWHWVDVGHGLVIGAFTMAVATFIAALLRSCSSLLANLPHR